MQKMALEDDPKATRKGLGRIGRRLRRRHHDEPDEQERRRGPGNRDEAGRRHRIEAGLRPASRTTLEAMRAIGHLTRIRIVLVLSGLALIPAPATAWGPVGHQVIANLAQTRLSPVARKSVAVLLRGATLASVSNDADAYRNSHPETARWHYVNIPLTAASYDPDRDCRSTPEGDCILAAIDRFAAVLGDRSRPQADRATALRFLVHLIGDLHNPMHTTTRNDRGGNDTTVTFFGEPTNLHAVWDAGLMERTGLTIRAWTAALNRSGLTESGRGTPVEWALESVRVAREHCYQLPVSHALGRAYLDASLPVLRLQLLRAGVRLAEFLNTVFEGTRGV